MKKWLLMLLSVLFIAGYSYAADAYLALTTNRTVEVFEADGSLLETYSFGVVSADQYHSIACGDFLPDDGNELAVLRSGVNGLNIVEYYSLRGATNGATLSRVAYNVCGDNAVGRLALSVASADIIGVVRPKIITLSVHDTLGDYAYLYTATNGFGSIVQRDSFGSLSASGHETLPNELIAAAAGLFSTDLDTLSLTTLSSDGYLETFTWTGESSDGCVRTGYNSLSSTLNEGVSVFMEGDRIGVLSTNSTIYFFDYYNSGTLTTSIAFSQRTLELDTDSALLSVVPYACSASDAQFSEIREAPVRDIAYEQTLYATNYGAYPDDQIVDTIAISNAFYAVRTSSVPTRLLFEPGRYLLDNTATNKQQLAIRYTTDVLIDFNGAELVCQNPKTGIIYVPYSENVIIKNCQINYDPVTHTEGILVSKNLAQNTIDFQVRDGFPDPTQSYFSEAATKFGYLLDDSIPGRIKDDALNYFHYTDVTQVASNVYRISLEDDYSDDFSAYWSGFETGDRLTLLARGASPSFLLDHSRQITFQNITLFNSLSGHYTAVASDALNFIDCKIRIQPGFWSGGNADGVHCRASRVGPWLEDCFIEGIGDDTLALYTRPFAVTGQPSSNCLEFALFHTTTSVTAVCEQDIAVGDVLDFLNPETGVIFETATVTDFDLSASPQTVTLDKAASGIDMGTTIDYTQVWNRSMGSGFVYKGCTIRNSRRYGGYMKASNGLIENNVFTGMRDRALAMRNEPSAPNGPFCHNVGILNNTISDCGRSYPESGGVFSIYSSRMNRKPALSGIAHSGISIEDNLFNNPEDYAMEICNTDGLDLIANRFRKVGSGDVELVSCVLASASESALDDLYLSNNVIDTNLYSGDVVVLNMTVDNDGFPDTYEEVSGIWYYSSLAGNSGSATRYSATPGACVKWTPCLRFDGTYEVYIYKVVEATHSDSNAKITVHHDGGDTVQYLNYRAGSSGWVSLGTFSFSEGTSGYVMNERQVGNSRADAVRFMLLD